MFYGQLVLAKKSSLTRLWLAVHWEKKLTKAQIYETNIPEACQHILRPYEDNPKTSLALRISAHLLLGVCRITYKKTSYLLNDASEVYSKIKDAVDRFRTSAELMMTDSFDDHQINIRDTHQVDLDYDFDMALPDVEDLTLELNLKNNLSRLDDITLKDDFTGNFNGLANMDFGMDDFGEHGQAEANFDNIGLEASSLMEHNRDASLLRHVNPFNDEPFEALQAPACFEEEAIDDIDMPPPVDDDMIDFNKFNMQESNLIFGGPAIEPNPQDSLLGGQNKGAPAIPNEDPDSFQLDSLDSEAILENQKGQRKRKRRLFIIDEYTEISNEELRANIDDHDDLLRSSEIAPPTKSLMKFKEIGSAAALLGGPAMAIGAKSLLEYYRSNCVLRVGDDRKSIDEANAELRDELQLSEIEETRLRNELPNEEMLPLGELDFNADHGFEGSLKTGNELIFDDNIENIPPMDYSFGVGKDRCDTPPEVHRLDFPRHDEYPVEDMLEIPQSTPAKKQKLDESSNSDTSVNGDASHRGLKKTRALQNTIALKLSLNNEITLSELIRKDSTRKVAAQKFYAILALKKMEAIDVRQEAPYEDIYITKGPNIEQVFA